PQPAHHLQLVAGRADGCQYPLAQAQQPDLAQQMVQRVQRGQVFLAPGRVLGPAETPVRSLLVHLADEHAGQAPAGGEPYTAGGNLEAQTHAARDLTHHPAHPRIGVGLIELGEPTAPSGRVRLTSVGRVGRRLAQPRVGAGPALSTPRWTPTLAVDTA